MTDGFLSRWSQRKQGVRQGKRLAEPKELPKAPVSVPENVVKSGADGAVFTGELATKGFSPDPGLTSGGVG